MAMITYYLSVIRVSKKIRHQSKHSAHCKSNKFIMKFFAIIHGSSIAIAAIVNHK